MSVSDFSQTIWQDLPFFNLMDQLHDRGFATAYLDLNAYPDVRSFAAAFTHMTSNALESNTEKLPKIFAGLKRVRPRVSVGYDGSLTRAVEVATEEKEALSIPFRVLSRLCPEKQFRLDPMPV